MQFLYGIHSIKAALKGQEIQIEKIYLLKDRKNPKLQEILRLAAENKVELEEISAEEFYKLLPGECKHQGILAYCQQLPDFNEATLKAICEDLSDTALFLILDGIQDPHNLGACLRTANVFGVHAVIAPKDKAVGLTAAAIKVASGAAGLTPFIRVTNLVRTIAFLQEQGIWVYGTDMKAAKPLVEIDMNRKLALVMGGEEKGLRQLTRKHCDELIYIPQWGEIESLNVSVAAGVCLYEARRQQIIVKN